MSNYHILTQEKNKKNIQVLFHIPIPSTGTNEAGISWRNAVVREQGGADAIDSQLIDISAAELSALKAGEIIEKITTVHFTSVNLTNAQRKAEIEATFNALTSSIIVEKQISLEWIGYAGDVI